jgi:hypothetical protein
MKTILRLSCLGALLAALAGCATTQLPPSPDTVNVLVNLPPSASLIQADRIADVFTDEVRHVFHQAGLKQPVENVRYVDDPDHAAQLLTINLVEWRFDRLGNITCTFTADLKTPRGTRHLGVYSDTSLGISRNPGWWGLADAFDEAAQGAIIDLVRAVVKSELLPQRTNAATHASPGSLNHV